MPNTAQAAKRLRQDSKRAEQNKAKMSRLRTEMKKFYAAYKENNARKAEGQLKVATSLLDKAGKTNLLHKNNVARKKAKMAKALYELLHRHDGESEK